MFKWVFDEKKKRCHSVLVLKSNFSGAFENTAA